MTTWCQATSIFQHDEFWLLIIELIICLASILLLIWLIKLVNRIERRMSVKFTFFTLSALFSFFLFIFISAVSLILLFLTGIIQDNYPPSGSYNVLNAAIKNTCYLDPQKNHCPRTVQDIINIEPEHFIKLVQNAHLTYQYNPQTNNYTLIVRDNNLKADDYRVVIFDPRLVTAKNYGNGVDFADTPVSWCNGRFVLNDPPPFPGPWDEIK